MNFRIHEGRDHGNEPALWSEDRTGRGTLQDNTSSDKLNVEPVTVLRLLTAVCEHDLSSLSVLIRFT
ncbi:hypothetical protein [Enterococcus larvae]|uniref:hypothetical protein n=1 Tax=Enterococcus larvae TaxID=2794352 RepID=UPI003F362494